SNKPNVDLAAGHLLYGLGWGYDLLYHDLSEKERTRYRDKLIKQARLMAVLTFVLHADDHIEKGQGCQFSIKAGRVKLLIDPTIEQPNEIQSAIEKNILTSPGPPGAVDKGERQERGQKLLLSTASPTTGVRFITRLRIEESDSR